MTKQNQSVTSRITKASASAIAFSSQPRISALIAEIRFDVDDRVDQYIETAQRVRELRQEFEPKRKKLKMTWYDYARHFLPVKDKNKLALLARISEAKTKREQEAIVRVFRNGQNNRAKTSRDKKREEKQRLARLARRMSWRRRALLAWVRQAPERDIERTWLHVGRVFLTEKQSQEILKSTSPPRKTKRKRKTND